MQKNPKHRSFLSFATCTTATARHFALSVLSLVTIPGLVPAQAQATAPSVTYAGPLVITQGGTYSGNYRSTDSSVPVIKIQTTQPVIIENCILAGAGDLIDAKNGGASIIVRNNKGYGLVQSADNIRHGRFVEASSAKSVTIEHNYFESTSGITIYQWSGNGTAQQTLTVRYNSAKNIDGRYRNGGCYLSQFLQQNQVHNLVGCEIAWNQIINEPNKSLVEDNISFYNSGGSANSPDLLHDNYIQGAFPFPANATSYNGTGFIIDGDAVAANTSAYVKAYRNQLVGTSGAGMNIAGGHDIQYYENRVINCGLLPDGSRVNSSWAAAAIWNAYGLPITAFYNNSMSNNTIGYYHAGGNTPYPDRQDASPGSCVNCTSTTSLPNRPLTLADEQAEWTLWQQKLSQNGVAAGPIGSSAPTGTTTTTTPTTTTPPTATLSVPTTGTVGAALALTASAATTSGTIAKVEFFNGATKLGEDLTSPYTFSYVPTAIGTLALTARATNSAGAATSSTPVNVTVSAATATTPTTTPGTTTTPANATFFRAINLGGAATTIDGQAWEAGTGAPNVTVNGSTFANQAITLNPATDAARASMIRSSAYNYSGPVSVAISGVASGTYSVYMYVWEDNNPETISLTLEGTTVKSNYNTGSAGHWERLGPFAASVTDGTINVSAVGSGANLSGVEIWKQTAGTTTTTPTTTTPPTATLSVPTTGTVGAALALTASAATTSGTIAKVEFFNGATKLGEDLTSPYTFSYVPTAIGTLALTARATNSAGAATSSTPVNVTVSAATATTPTTTPGTTTTPANATFFRAINLGGAATTIDGQAWEAGTGAPNVTVNGSTFANQAITLNPATDAARASMIRSSAYNYSGPVSVAISGVASGTYSVYMYVWEDNNPETISLTLEGTTVKSNYNTGSAGHWERLGPFAASVTDGTINVSAVGSGANLSGVEIWKQTTGTTTTTSTTPTTTTPTPTGAQVTSFTLINADTDKDIQTIANGAILNLAALPTRNLNIRANVAGATGSVVFALSGAATQNQTESTAPYALFSDYQGNYNAWTPNVGSYSLTARPYSGGGGAGTLGTVTTIRFSVTSQAL